MEAALVVVVVCAGVEVALVVIVVKVVGLAVVLEVSVSILDSSIELLGN